MVAVTHLVTDLLDPDRGSEFQIAWKALRALLRHAEGPVHLWTCARAGNEGRIRAWLDRHDSAGRVRLSCVPMRRASPQGHHRHRLDLLLDLLGLYRRVRDSLAPGDRVWKCGQSHLAFGVLFLTICRADAVGPVSGLERPPWRPVAHIGQRIRLRHLACAAAIAGMGRLFGALSRWRRVGWVLAATEIDRQALAPAVAASVERVGEVSLDDLPRGAGPSAPGPATAGPLLWAGALIPRKNPLLALDVIARVLRNHPQDQARMIGEGPLEGPLRRRWSALEPSLRDRIHIEPTVSRALFADRLAGARVLLVTAFREVNSVQVFEALAFDRAVVAPAISGLTRSVGACGELFALHGEAVVRHAADAVERARARGPRTPPRAWLSAEAEHEDRVLRRMLQTWQGRPA